MAKNVVELVVKARTLGLEAIKKYKQSLGEIASTQKNSAKQADKLAKATKKQGAEAKKSSGSNSKLGNTVKKMNTDFKELAVNIASAAAGLAAIGAVKGRADVAGQLVLDAQRLNVSVDALTKAQYAAQIGAGVAAENFGDALTDLRIKINEFATIGSGGAVDFLQKVGLSAEELNRQNPVDQLLAIADASDKIGENVNDFGTALDQLGSDNLRDLLPILVDNAAEFKRLQDEADSLGLTLNSFDAAAMRDLSKESSKLGQVITSIGDKLAADVSPTLSEMARSFTGIFGYLNNQLSTTGDELSSITKIVVVFQTFTQTAIQGISFTIDSVVTGFKTLVSNSAGLFVSLANNTMSFFDDVSIAALKSFKKILTPLADINDLAAKALGNVDGQITSLSNKTYGKPQWLLDLEADTDASKQSLVDRFKYEYRTIGELQDSIASKFKNRQEPAQLRDNTPSNANTRERAEAEQALLDQQIANQLAANKRRIDAEKSRLDQEKALQLAALDEKEQLDVNSAEQSAQKRLEIEKAYNKQVAALEIQGITEQLAAIEKQRAAYKERMAVSGASNSINALTVKTELAKYDGQIADLNGAADVIRQQLDNANALLDEQIALENKVAEATANSAKVEEVADKLQELRDKFSNGQLGFGELESQSGPLISQLELLMSSVGDTSKLEELRSLISNVKNDFNELRTVGAEIGQALSDNILNGIDGIISGTKSMGDAFRDMARQVVSELLKIYAKQLLVKSLEGLSGVGGGLGSLASGALSAFFHQGGIVGQASGMRRIVDPAIFNNAVKYHTGGVVGLQPNEVPAVLQKGEEVLTANDPRHRDNLNGGGATAQPQAVNITNSIDGQSVVDAFEGNGGDRVIMNVIRANKNEIKSF